MYACFSGLSVYLESGRNSSVLLVFILCPVIVMWFRVHKNNVELEKEKEMTPFEREKDYVRRTILLKDFAKEIKTTNIFVVLEKRFRSAIAKNINVIKKYGWKIALYECVSDYFAEIIPVTGGFIYGCYRLLVAENIPISQFSVFCIYSLVNFGTLLNLGNVGSSLRKRNPQKFRCLCGHRHWRFLSRFPGSH